MPSEMANDRCTSLDKQHIRKLDYIIDTLAGRSLGCVRPLQSLGHPANTTLTGPVRASTAARPRAAGGTGPSEHASQRPTQLRHRRRRRRA
jgi:hypothetical protein